MTKLAPVSTAYSVTQSMKISFTFILFLLTCSSTYLDISQQNGAAFLFLGNSTALKLPCTRQNFNSQSTMANIPDMVGAKLSNIYSQPSSQHPSLVNAFDTDNLLDKLIDSVSHLEQNNDTNLSQLSTTDVPKEDIHTFNDPAPQHSSLDDLTNADLYPDYDFDLSLIAPEPPNGEQSADRKRSAQDANLDEAGPPQPLKRLKEDAAGVMDRHLNVAAVPILSPTPHAEAKFEDADLLVSDGNISYSVTPTEHGTLHTAKRRKLEDIISSFAQEKILLPAGINMTSFSQFQTGLQGPHLNILQNTLANPCSFGTEGPGTSLSADPEKSRTDFRDQDSFLQQGSLHLPASFSESGAWVPPKPLKVQELHIAKDHLNYSTAKEYATNPKSRKRSREEQPITPVGNENFAQFDDHDLLLASNRNGQLAADTETELHVGGPHNSLFEDVKAYRQQTGGLPVRETMLPELPSDFLVTQSTGNSIRQRPIVRGRSRKRTRTRIEDMDPAMVHVCMIAGCNKKFAKKYNLKIHQRRHTGDLPFICEYRGCSKKFMWLSSFSRHQRVHESKRHSVRKIQSVDEENEESDLSQSDQDLVGIEDGDGSPATLLKIGGVVNRIEHNCLISVTLACCLKALESSAPQNLLLLWRKGCSEELKDTHGKRADQVNQQQAGDFDINNENVKSLYEQLWGSERAEVVEKVVEDGH